jgi:quercetin dioxygenase-like cupin family protein
MFKTNNLMRLKHSSTALAYSSVILFGLMGFSFTASATESLSEAPIIIDRTLSHEDIDPAVYFKENGANDPYGAVYKSFRERRANDMADPNKPPPIEPYEAVHRSQEKPWNTLEEILPFDWESLRKDFPLEAKQLSQAVKARLVFDHPDIKITQLMVGPGATLPGHAGGSPGFYYVIDGSGQVTVEGKTQTVTAGAIIKLNPYDVRRIYADTDKALKIVWIRWAPDGDQSFMAAGYYLTGANQHVQPKEGVLPKDYQFWGEKLSSTPVTKPTSVVNASTKGSLFADQSLALLNAKKQLGQKSNPYPSAPTFSHEGDSNWLSKDVKGANYFWFKDISKLGGLLDRWVEVMRYKGIFQAARPDGGWDFNISQMVWGPHSRYVEHSHSIPEFYYMLSGPVEHWIGDEKYIAMPGDIFTTNSYVPHQSRGIVDGLAFRNIGASWAPNGDREVFKKPFYLVEPLKTQPAKSILGDSPKFH